MKILICLDYSKAARIVLTEARIYFNSFPQAEIFVYNVIDMTLITEGTEYTALEAEAVELKEMAEKEFDGRTISFVTETGNPAGNIVGYCKQTCCDLLILGTHGRTGMRHLMTGSVAEKVIRNAPCNTLVIPMRGKI